MQAQLSKSSLVSVKDQKAVFSVWISFAEIYNEKVFDLLEPRRLRNQMRQNLALGEDDKGQVYVKGKRNFVVNL
jgi:kinesin family protein 20